MDSVVHRVQSLCEVCFSYCLHVNFTIGYVAQLPQNGPMLTCDKLAKTCTFVPVDRGIVPLVYSRCITDASNSKIISCFMTVYYSQREARGQFPFDIYAFLFEPDYVFLAFSSSCRISEGSSVFVNSHRWDRHVYNRKNVSSNTYFYCMDAIG